MREGVITISIYYDRYKNNMVHEDGRVLDNILHLISYKDLEDLKRVGGVKYVHSDEDDVLYEISSEIPDDEIILYYDVDENVMLDGYGYIMFNVFSLIYPHDLILFKKKKKDMKFYGRNGKIIQLLYPIENIEGGYDYNFWRRLIEYEKIWSRKSNIRLYTDYDYWRSLVNLDIY